MRYTYADQMLNKIEHGVPIPPIHISAWHQLIRSMEIGNSVVCNYHQATYLKKVSRSMKRKFTMRSLDTGFVRIWRIK